MMANSYVSSGGWEYSIISVGGKWSWRVVANNIPSATQKFYVQDIFSPFGELSKVASPIPGDVIEAMNETLSGFKSQLNPVLTLISSSSISATVTQAGPKASAGSITVSNTGALGSFMQVTATSTVPWITVSPGVVSGLGKNAQGAFNISINPATLESSSSPYTAIVNLFEPKTSTTIPVTLTVTVLPQSVIWANASSLSFSYNIESNSISAAQSVTLQNLGPALSILSGYISKVQNISPWLNINPTSFGPLDFGETQDILFTPVKSGVTKIPGTYTETVVFVSDLADNSPYVISVSMTVT